jgi:hypothetical protein
MGRGIVSRQGGIFREKIISDLAPAAWCTGIVYSVTLHVYHNLILIFID